MNGTTTVNGMVLSAMPMGEYDKRLTILTVEYGKISAFAKGARRPNSTLLACSQPFSYGEFVLYAGRNSYTVTSAQISNYFPMLRENMEKIYFGMYFCEYAEYFTREGNDEREILKLLYQSLRALESEKFDKRLVRRIFELKLICLAGEAPQVFECVCCKAKEDLSCFDLSRDGLVCGKCLASSQAGKGGGKCADMAEADLQLLWPYQREEISASLLYALQFIVATPPARLYQFALKEEVLRELERFTERYIKKHVEREMKSKKIMEEMEL